MFFSIRAEDGLYIAPDLGVAVDIQIQGINENERYAGLDVSGNQIEVESHYVLSEQAYF